ncbi:MAG: hypothetical protein HY718_15635 [Planctomycetes bacterium]|nr:hypothetical protein [Planctomycetota bacterium]
MLGPIAAADQPATERPAAPEEVRIDDSSAQGIADAVTHMASMNDWTRLPEVLLAEQAEAMRAMIDAVAPFAEAVGDFRKAANEKFAGHAIQIQVPDAWLQHLIDMADELHATVEEAGDEEAKVMLTAGPADSTDARKIELTARRIDNGWRLALPDFQAPPDPAQVAKELEGKTAAFADLTRRMHEDDIADVDAAKSEVEKVLAGDYEVARPAETTEKPADAATPEPQPTTPEPRRQRERDQVDEVYSGPGMLRNR